MDGSAGPPSVIQKPHPCLSCLPHGRLGLAPRAKEEGSPRTERCTDPPNAGCAELRHTPKSKTTPFVIGGCGSKPMGCTTHFGTYFSGWIESDVHWGLTDLDFDPWWQKQAKTYQEQATAKASEVMSLPSAPPTPRLWSFCGGTPSPPSSSWSSPAPRPGPQGPVQESSVRPRSCRGPSGVHFTCWARLTWVSFWAM